MYRITVDALPPSLNVYMRMHFRKRMELKEEWSWLFIKAVKEANLPKPLPTPFTLNTTQFCKRIVRDVDNAIVAHKLLADFLKTNGYIKDDNPKYIHCGILNCKKAKENKLVIIIS